MLLLRSTVVEGVGFLTRKYLMYHQNHSVFICAWNKTSKQRSIAFLFLLLLQFNCCKEPLLPLYVFYSNLHSLYQSRKPLFIPFFVILGSRKKCFERPTRSVCERKCRCFLFSLHYSETFVLVWMLTEKVRVGIFRYFV